MHELIDMQRRYHSSARLHRGVSVVEKGAEVRVLRHSWSGQIEYLSRISKSDPNPACSRVCYETRGLVARGVPTSADDLSAFRMITAAVGSQLTIRMSGRGSREAPEVEDTMRIEMASPSLAHPVEHRYRIAWRTDCCNQDRVCCVPERTITGYVEAVFPITRSDLAAEGVDKTRRKACKLVPWVARNG